MKIGFSSLVCPTWDLGTIVTQAVKLGFDGVEFRGLRGELHLPLAPELASDPDGVRRLFQENKLQLISLASSVMLSAKNRRELGRQKAAVTEFLELAARLGCPSVRIFAGEVETWDTQRAALARTADALISLAPVAARLDVTVVVENGGDFPGSADLWFLLDAVGHPRVRACWNQCHSMTLGERTTTSIPRLGQKLGLVHVCDAEFEAGVLARYKPLGEGHAEIGRGIELLKGMAYDGFVVFEWPKLWVESLPEPDVCLPHAAKFLRDAVQAKQPVLSAYKGDKNAPRFVARHAPAAPVG